MLAAGDTAKKVILKVRELINNKELFAFLLLIRVLLYVFLGHSCYHNNYYYDNKNAPVTFVNSTGALIGLIFVQELCGIGHCF